MLDYKYIEQLLERYWECQTTLEEEAILRAFFAQENVPVELLQYRQLFVYENVETKMDTLGDDFDKRMLAAIEQEKCVKARTITINERLRPLYKAAAAIAIVITLGTAAQKALEPSDAPYPTDYAGKSQVTNGPSVAVTDSVRTDSVRAAR